MIDKGTRKKKKNWNNTKKSNIFRSQLITWLEKQRKIFKHNKAHASNQRQQEPVPRITTSRSSKHLQTTNRRKVFIFQKNTMHREDNCSTKNFGDNMYVRYNIQRPKRCEGCNMNIINETLYQLLSKKMKKSKLKQQKVQNSQIENKINNRIYIK